LSSKIVETDVLVIGAGGAGARAAIEASKSVSRVALVDKGLFGKSGCTAISIGGINVAILPDDSPKMHFRDTVVGGEFLNNQQLVDVMVSQGFECIMELEDFGMVFARQQDGKTLRLGQSGGHTFPRVLFEFYPDRVGTAMMRALRSEVARRHIDVLEEVIITDLLKSEGKVVGALGLDCRTGEFIVFNSRSTILATGGAGQLNGWDTVSAITTNSLQNTGDGHSLALRAGAILVDMEFIQYMPMGFVYPKAVHGVGLGEPGFESIVLKAKLYNAQMERFMKRYEPERIERTTRDKLTRAITTEILEGRGTEHGGVYYDYRENPDYPRDRPYRCRLLMEYDSKDPTKELIEGAPTWHYLMGGAKIDEFGQTSLEGLFACGEVAGGIHGANRLGGNSLLDTQVFGVRAGAAAARYASKTESTPRDREVSELKNRWLQLLSVEEGVRPYKIRHSIQDIIISKVGPFRSGAGLAEAKDLLSHIRSIQIPKLKVAGSSLAYNSDFIEAIETLNMLDVAEVIVAAALTRQESRGAHFRLDFPRRDDGKWLKNILVRREERELRMWTEDVVLTKMQVGGEPSD
jgi:fumarate reductase (CoM/CoB) subunit A